MIGWLEALPGELLRSRPVLGVGYAHVLLAGGELDGVEDRLRDAERWLDTTADMGVRPHPEVPVRRRRWSSWTTRRFAVYRVRSRSPVPDWPWPVAMCQGPCRTLGGRSRSHPRTTI